MNIFLYKLTYAESEPDYIIATEMGDALGGKNPLMIEKLPMLATMKALDEMILDLIG